VFAQAPVQLGFRPGPRRGTHFLSGRAAHLQAGVVLRGHVGRVHAAGAGAALQDLT